MSIWLNQPAVRTRRNAQAHSNRAYIRVTSPKGNSMNAFNSFIGNYDSDPTVAKELLRDLLPMIGLQGSTKNGRFIIEPLNSNKPTGPVELWESLVGPDMVQDIRDGMSLMHYASVLRSAHKAE